MRKSNAIICLSEMERDLSSTVFPTMKNKLRVIPNGIDPTIFGFCPPSNRPTTPPLRILFVGQLVESKGVLNLLEAFINFRKEFPAELTFVHHVDFELANLEDRVRQAGIVQNVHFLGKRTSHEIANLHASHHVLVLPSKLEALPSVVIESLFCGTKVIANRVAAVPEQLAATDSILLADYDVTTLERCFREQAVMDHRLRDELAYSIRRSAIERYSVEEMCNAHLALYRDLLSK